MKIMDKDWIKQEFKELNLYLDQLCINGHEVKDAGHLWIAFADKFNAFKKRLLEFDPHEVSKVKCDLCGKDWVAVRPEGLEKLECPNCGNMVNFENV